MLLLPSQPLGFGRQSRAVPPPFAAEIEGRSGEALVLHAISPSKYASPANQPKGVAAEARAVQLNVEKHTAAKSVVAKKMLQARPTSRDLR